MRFAVLLCKKFGDFGKKERERAWRVTRKLGSLVILAERERERVPGESLESI